MEQNLYFLIWSSRDESIFCHFHPDKISKNLFFLRFEETFWNKAPKSSIRGLQPRKKISTKFGWKNYGSSEISVGGLLDHLDFMPFFRFFRFLRQLVQKSQNLVHFEKKIWKSIFRKRGIKSRLGGTRPKFLASRSFLIESLWKIFSRSEGGRKSTILGLFSKVDPRNFYQLGKNVFLRPRFF